MKIIRANETVNTHIAISSRVDLSWSASWIKSVSKAIVQAINAVKPITFCCHDLDILNARKFVIANTNKNIAEPNVSNSVIPGSKENPALNIESKASELIGISW